MEFSKKDVAGVVFQYPDTRGDIYDPSSLISKAKENGVGLLLVHNLHSNSRILITDRGHMWF